MIDIELLKSTHPVSPIVHMNGTGKSLLTEVDDAYTKVDEALESVKKMTVHSRDFYVLGDNWESVFKVFWDQTTNRIEKLEELRSDLMVIRHKIKCQLKDQ